MMKLKLILSLIFIGAISLTSAQDLKIGYTNVDYILTNMPEFKQVQSDLQAYSKQYETRFQAKMEEYQAKVAEYQQNAQNMLDAVRQDKEEEIRNLEQSIQKFQQEAQSSLQKKEQQLLEPLYTKITTAINTVAEAQSYTHVFTNDAGGFPILLYAREEDNITEVVMKELGITASAPGN